MASLKVYSRCGKSFTYNVILLSLLFGILLMLFHDTPSGRYQYDIPWNHEIQIQQRNDEFLSDRPLYFEVNRGQFKKGIDFIARGKEYTLALTGEEAIFSLAGNTSSSLHLQWVEAKVPSKTFGLDEAIHQSSYFMGREASRWYTGIQNFKKVCYENIYNGIDLHYYGCQGGVEFDFVVKPGMDPSQIRMCIIGEQEWCLDKLGQVVIPTVSGQLVIRAPLIYQEQAGVRELIGGAYYCIDEHTLAFSIDKYDVTQPLIIDPEVTYATYLGGSGYDTMKNIAVDSDGFIYVLGTTSENFFSSSTIIDDGDSYFYVTKMDDVGNFLYTALIGQQSSVSGLAVDAAGCAHVAGYTGSDEFPVTGNAFQNEYQGGNGDAFYMKLSADGSALEYSTYLGGEDHQGDYSNGSDVAVDAAGCAYITGETMPSVGGDDFPTRNGYQMNYEGYYIHAFVSKIDPSKSGDESLIYSSLLGGDDDSYGKAIDVAPDGSACVTGNTKAKDFPTQNPYQGAMAGRGDAFVAKFTPSGDALTYSTFLGGPDAGQLDSGRDIAVDATGSVYVVGNARDGFPTSPGAFKTTGSGGFVTKYDPAGTVVYSTIYPNAGNGIGVALTGDVYITTSKQINGNFDAGVAALASNGSDTLFTTFVGGSGHEYVVDLALDNLENMYLLGSTYSADFPVFLAQQTGYGGGTVDGFIAKFRSVKIIVNSTGDDEDNDLDDDVCWTGQFIDRDGKLERERTLRAALETIARRSGTITQFINFNIPGEETPRIEVEKILPPIDGKVVIDGTTQKGGFVEVQGDNLDDGFYIQYGDAKIKGLIINGFQDGIVSKGNLVLEGNRINFNKTGTDLNVDGDIISGVTLFGGSNCIIGGEEESKWNYIGGGIHSIKSGDERRFYQNVIEIPPGHMITRPVSIPIDNMPVDYFMPERVGPTPMPWNHNTLSADDRLSSFICAPRLLEIHPTHVTGMTYPGAQVFVYKAVSIGSGQGRYFPRRVEPLGSTYANQAGYFACTISAGIGTQITAMAIDSHGRSSEFSQLKRPVIFLPGVAGSFLEAENGDDLWLPWGWTSSGFTERLERLSMKESGTESNEAIHVDGILEGAGKPYTDILNAISAAGYYGDEENDDPSYLDLWRFPFDWRYSPYDLADQLKNFIDAVTSYSGWAVTLDVDIVTHSYGGMVASQYVKYYNRESASKVHRLITIASPYMGTPKAIAGHTVGYAFGFDEDWTLMPDYYPDWGRITQAWRNIPILYSLLPSRNYWQAMPENITFWHVDLNGRPLLSWDDTHRFFNAPKVDQNNQPDGMNRNGWIWNKEQNYVHKLINDWTSHQQPPQIFRIVGNIPSSTPVAWDIGSLLSGISGSKRQESDDTFEHVLFRESLRPLMGNGDETVSLNSSTLGRISGGTDFSGVDESLWISPFESYAQKHLDIVEHEPVIQRVITLLKSGYIVQPAVSPAMMKIQAIQSMANGIDRELFYIHGTAPIAVWIENSTGLKSGPTSVDSLEQIRYDLSSVRYIATRYNVTLSIPPDSSYTVTVQALDAGATVQTTRIRANAASRDNILFANQDLAAGGQMQFALNDGGTDPDQSFLVDSNGDGDFEGTLDPATRLTSNSPLMAIPSPKPFKFQVEKLMDTDEVPVVTFNLPDVGGPIWDWSLSGTSSWISPNAMSGQTPASVDLTLEVSNLNPGQYSDTVFVHLEKNGFT
ncbi:SBBP repeat-containing protein, partial [bacterium]|nr:SBBP repeat-containing protein [bacterium]